MEAVRFACQPGCTNCCRRQGFVYLTEHDTRRAAEFLGLEPAAFERQYVYRTRHLRRLRVASHAPCPFLLDDGCRIHPAKPTQCRLFPFWPELVEDKRAWKIAAIECPGIGQGPLIQIESAREIAGEMRAAYPSSYRTRR